MSFPGRPQMVPGMQVGPPPGMQMPPYMGLGAPPPLMGGVMPPHMIPPPMGMPPGGPGMRPGGYRPQGPPMQSAGALSRSPAFTKRVVEQGSGPPVTVFVGNITERAPDAMIRHVLAACGQVVSWKRVQGASGRAPAFGFCEYGSPDAGLRAVRLLHDLELGGKKLVVKVDAKTKVILDEFKEDRRRRLGVQRGGGGSPLQDEKPAEDDDNTDYMDDDMKNADQSALDRISVVVSDYDSDMKNYNPPNDKERKAKAQEKLLKLGNNIDGGPGGEATPNFDDGEMEEGKRDLITREIGKFREIMKKQEEEKEAERRRREAKDKDRPRSPPEHRRSRRDRSASPVSPRRSRSRGTRSRSPPPLPRSQRNHSGSPPPLPASRSSRPQPPSRSPSPESTYSNKLRAKSNRDWRRSHSRSRERDEPVAKRSEREIQKEREMEEEAKERKKQDRKAREKEAAYQERLRNWEGRERRKTKEHAKEKDKERRGAEEQAREARRLKEFLEDYDDDRDDMKFYKGRELSRRLALRETELESDMRDRQREREELEDLRAKVYADKQCENPSAEFERIKAEREQQYKPKFLVRVEAKAPPAPSISEPRGPCSPPPPSNGGSNLSAPPPPSPWRPPPTEDSGSAMTSPPAIAHAQQANTLGEEDSQLSAVSQASMPAMDDSISPAASRGFSGWRSPPPPEPPQSAPSSPVPVLPPQAPGGVSIPVGGKKRKLEIREVFNTEDDDDGSLGASGRKRKPLVPLDYGDEKGLKKKDGAGGDTKASQEEKRKHIKSLIDKIPTDKEALFGFPIDWEAVDQNLMERRIRPWINKKIIEYIGEPEPTLVDFICSKVLVGSPPQGILDDVQMVLDDEAEVFVVKMWRLLIYEIEAKKLGLVK